MTKSDNGERARGRNRVDRLDWGERRVKYERSYVGRGEKIVPDDVEKSCRRAELDAHESGRPDKRCVEPWSV